MSAHGGGGGGGRHFRLGAAVRELHGAALAFCAAGDGAALQALKFYSRRYARELARMRERNAPRGRR